MSQSLQFNYTTLPNNIRFGPGRLSEVKELAQQMGASRPLILSSPYQTGLADQVAALLGDLCLGIHPKAVQHVPHQIVAEAVLRTQNEKIDLLVAPGGGSTIGLAKGVALETGLPILAIPTTYAGSEMTHIWASHATAVKRPAVTR